MTGADLAAALAALGLTQQQFAERVGVERVTVNRWVNGARRVPAWLTLALDNMQRKQPTQQRVR